VGSPPPSILTNQCEPVYCLPCAIDR
jgi:hypothetical protein